MGIYQIILFIIFWSVQEKVKYLATRMHSSRMRTVHCSGRLSCHACPPPMPHMSPAMHAPLPCTPYFHACPPPHMPPPCMSLTMHAPHHTPIPCTPPTTHALPPVDRIPDTRLWKHYLSATTVADGKKLDGTELLMLVRRSNLCWDFPNFFKGIIGEKLLKKLAILSWIFNPKESSILWCLNVGQISLLII